MTEEENKKISSILEELGKDKGVPSWLAPLLSGLGSMGGSYMLWVKPLQDNFKAMGEQIETLKEELDEVKQKQKEVDRNFYDKLQHALKGLETKPSKRIDENEEEDELMLPVKKEKYIRQTKTKKSVSILK